MGASTDGFGRDTDEDLNPDGHALVDTAEDEESRPGNGADALDVAANDPVDDDDAQAPCTGAFVRCDNACVDLDVEPLHCGGCGRVCEVEVGSNQEGACVGGLCLVGCAEGYHTVSASARACDYACVATRSATEICDGLDNDCNGWIDERDSNYVATLCVEQRGVCSGAVARCDDGVPRCDARAFQAHHASYDGAAEYRCDGLDNNCNGQVDEGCFMNGDALEPAFQAFAPLSVREVAMAASDRGPVVAGIVGEGETSAVVVWARGEAPVLVDVANAVALGCWSLDATTLWVGTRRAVVAVSRTSDGRIVVETSDLSTHVSGVLESMRCRHGEHSLFALEQRPISGGPRATRWVHVDAARVEEPRHEASSSNRLIGATFDSARDRWVVVLLRMNGTLPIIEVVHWAPWEDADSWVETWSRSGFAFDALGMAEEHGAIFGYALLAEPDGLYGLRVSSLGVDETLVLPARDGSTRTRALRREGESDLVVMWSPARVRIVEAVAEARLTSSWSVNGISGVAAVYGANHPWIFAWQASAEGTDGAFIAVSPEGRWLDGAR